MKKKVFLLIDDDADDTYLFKEILEEVSPAAELHVAFNGKEGLNIIKTKPDFIPDVIFLDLNMPLLDGKQCLAELKKDERLKHIPVIVYSTSSQSNEIKETIQKGAIGFITKPSNIKNLKFILKNIAENIHADLSGTLKSLSALNGTFIAC